MHVWYVRGCVLRRVFMRALARARVCVCILSMVGLCRARVRVYVCVRVRECVCVCARALSMVGRWSGRLSTASLLRAIWSL